MIDFFIETKEKCRFAIRVFKKNPIESILILLPVFLCAMTVVAFVVLYVKFIRAGGYSTQIDIVKVEGFSKAFTSGNAKKIYDGFFGNSTKIICFIIILLLIFTYMKQERVWKKILFMLTTTVLILSVALISWINAFSMEYFNFSREQKEKIWVILHKIGQDRLSLLLIVAFVAFILFLVLLFKSKINEIVVYCSKYIFASFAVIPLLLLIFENIIALFLGVAFFAIFILFLNVGGSMLSGESGMDFYGDGITIKEGSTFLLSSGMSICKTVDSNGDKYIEVRSGDGIKRVCDFEDFSNGRFTIYNAYGRKMTENDIDWKY